VPEVAVLVSLGRHPTSGRARRADLDARAVELALSIPGATLHLVHAGDPNAPALRDYLGMGVDRLTVLSIGPEDDPVPALIDHLTARRFDLVLAGLAAEAGEASGLVPYLIAEALGAPLLAGIVALERQGARVLGHQVLPGGRRRAYSAPTPAVLTIARQAPDARPVAFARARRGTIVTVHAATVPDEARRSWRAAPARPRPKRLRARVAGGAKARIDAATRLATGAGKVMVDPSAEEAAWAIWDYLVTEGIVEDSTRSG
jgi:electron transfer flavoprotein beta subunit